MARLGPDSAEEKHSEEVGGSPKHTNIVKLKCKYVREKNTQTMWAVRLDIARGESRKKREVYKKTNALEKST